MTRAEREALWGWGWDDEPDDSDEYDREPDEDDLIDLRYGEQDPPEPEYDDVA